MVQHGRLCACADLHHRIGIAQPGARSVIPECRSFSDPSHEGGSRTNGGTAWRSFQRAEHTAAGAAGGDSRSRQLRFDYDGRRSARGAARAETAVLTFLPWRVLEGRVMLRAARWAHAVRELGLGPA